MIQGRVKRSDFDFILEKMHNRLASWKNKLLNKAGRLTLAKSVLNSIPNYYMQIAWLPQSICSDIDRLTRNFIWKGCSDKGVHLVGWDVVTSPKNRGGLGVRLAREANTSMLGKLVWQLHVNSKKLWVDVVRNKYCGTTPFMEVKKKQGSFSWNSIQKAKMVLYDGYGFRLGNGNSSFWYTNWTGLGTLNQFVPYIDIHDAALCISDIIQNGAWQVGLLYSTLPPHVIERILTLPSSTNDAVSDSLVWKGHTNGIYTANQGYKWLLHQRNGAGSGATTLDWNWIWKSYAPEKIKFFIWTACHNSLPTLAMLHRRGMFAAPTCPRCQHPVEDILHCLRDCNLSAQLWHYLGVHDSDFFTESNVYTWLQQGCSRDDPSLFISAVWWLWRAHNTIVIAKEDFSISTLQYRTQNYASLVSICKQVAASNVSIPRWVSWHSSREDCIVLNTDGSSLGNPGPSGFGGLLRRSDGSWIKGFAGHIGTTNNLHAELMALLHGIQLAWEDGHRHIVCYSDSLHAIQLATSPLNQWHVYASIIATIQDLMKRPWQFSLVHTLREGNMPADILTKMGSSIVQPMLMLELPSPDLLLSLQPDVRRIEILRP